MTFVYGLAITSGAIGVLVAVALALNPDRRPFDPRLRLSLLAVFGFGLAGMSASFGGWTTGLALVAAVLGGALLVLFGIRYGPAGEE